MGRVNLITGPNAVGKSSVLEAILRFGDYSKQKNNTIQFGANQATVRLDIKKGTSLTKHYLVAQRGTNGTSIKKNQPLGPLATVYFGPNDNNLFNGGPQERRSFLDSACGTLKREYRQNLTEYQKIVRQKNDILKRGAPNKTLLETYNYQLIQQADFLIKDRLLFLEEISQPTSATHGCLTKKTLTIDIVYQSKTNIGDVKDSLGEQLRAKEELETIRGCCLVGPHRDDLSFLIDGVDVAEFGSQGEKKTACLALKIAQLKNLQENNLKPLLVLDDALSELDIQRRQLLLELVAECEQTFISATDHIGLELGEGVKRFELK